MNSIYGSTPWSFENTGTLEIGFGSEFGASREIVLRYNQQITGFIKLASIDYGREDYDLSVHFDLLNGRTFGGLEVFRLARSLAEVVYDSNDEMQNTDNNINILLMMTDAMWQVGEEVHGNPEVKFVFKGKAGWYLRSAWVPSNVAAQ